MRSSLLLALSLIYIQASAQKGDALEAAWKGQVQSLAGTGLKMDFVEVGNELYHSPEPWMQLHYAGTGNVTYSPGVFTMMDTLTRGSRTLYEHYGLSPADDLYVDYRSKTPAAPTKSEFTEKLLETARYTPAALIQYFVEQKATRETGKDKQFLFTNKRSAQR
jgi:hypothetical protein